MFQQDFCDNRLQASIVRISLQSTLLVWVRYETRTQRLEVFFRDGGRYQYFDVPDHCYQQLLESDSKGACFNRSIRNCFPCQDLSVPNAPIVLPTRKN